MHPEILRAMNAQRSHEMQERAHQSRLARMAIRGRRHRRNLPDDDFVVPAVPDYVDGSFRTDQAVGQVASDAGRAPARHAA
jgi:hypothetical protein